MKLPDLTRVNGFAYKPGDLVLSPNSPLDSARRLLSDRYVIDASQLLHFHHGLFYGWTGTHYIELTPQYMSADIYHFLEYARRYSENDEGKRITIPFNPKSAHVNEIKRALEAAAFLSDQLDAPAWTDDTVPDLSPVDLISCDNGLLHLPTRAVLPHTPKFFTLNSIGYAYNPKAGEPVKWLAFLRQLWSGDQQSVDTLQEMFGYCLMADTSQQKAFMLIGPKRSGKGTIARILEAVIGTHNCISPTLASIGTNFGLAPFMGKRLATISDARISGKTDTSIVAERVLAITGEDSVTVDRKYLSPWTGKLDTRILVISNELPRIADASGALPSRFVLLLMTQSFYGREDHALTQRLLEERPAILNWAIDGYDRLCARGYFEQPESAADALRELEDLASPIAAFLRDRCFIQTGRATRVDDLYEAWCKWCDAQGRDRPGTKQSFGRDLRTVLPHLKITSPRNDFGIQERHYDGIAIQS